MYGFYIMFKINKQVIERYEIVSLSHISNYYYSKLLEYKLLEIKKDPEYPAKKIYCPTNKAYINNICIHDPVRHEDVWFMDKFRYFLSQRGEIIM